MAMRTIINELKGEEVKEVPEKLKPYFTISFLKESIAKGLDNYHAKYIVTNSPQPLFHVCYGGMILSYLVALPEERRHLAHQEQNAAAAAHRSDGSLQCHGLLVQAFLRLYFYLRNCFYGCTAACLSNEIISFITDNVDDGVKTLGII